MFVCTDCNHSAEANDAEKPAWGELKDHCVIQAAREMAKAAMAVMCVALKCMSPKVKVQNA